MHRLIRTANGCSRAILTAARSRLGITVACVAVFLGSCSLLHHLWYGAAGNLLGDTPHYETYAQATVSGEVPYRDFSIEYPPGFLVPMLTPAATASPDNVIVYSDTFERWMIGAGVAALLFAAAALAALREPPKRFVTVLGFIAVSPLLLGTLMLSRFDLWVAALAIGGLSGLLTGRERVGGALIGAAIATKLWPAVLVPLGLAWVWRRQGRAAALRWLAVVTAVCAGFFLPFAVLAPGGLAHSFDLQLGRPLQIESLGSALLLAAHNLGGLPVSVVTSYGSENLVASGASALAAATSLLQLLALCAVWIAFARGPARPERLAAAAAAAVAVCVALAKVFSPQYLIWLIPFVPLVRSRLASLLLALALVSTAFYYPAHYVDLHELQQWAAWLLLARDLVAVLLAVELGRLLVQRDPLGETTHAAILDEASAHGAGDVLQVVPVGQAG